VKLIEKERVKREKEIQKIEKLANNRKGEVK
jgi:hypothetical protein